MDNPALDVAINVANELKKPLAVFFGLHPKYPNANLRHYAFLVDGICETKERVEKRSAAFVFRPYPDHDLIKFCKEVRACLVVGDENPMREPEGWRQSADQKLNAPSPFSLFIDRPSLAIAHGACLMFERESYEKIGGHAVVKDRIFEDVRLAQLWRARGARGLCLDGQDVVRVRMYESFDGIRRGFQKNFFPAFRRELSFWAFILFHVIVFLSPFLLLIATPNRRLAMAAGVILLTRFVLAAWFRHPLWSVLLHPLSELIVIWIGLFSWRRCKSGQGVEWRGRQYHPTN